MSQVNYDDMALSSLETLFLQFSEKLLELELAEKPNDNAINVISGKIIKFRKLSMTEQKLNP